MIEPTITLIAENPFYDLFPNGIVPVQAPVPGAVELVMIDGVDVQAVYMMDAGRLTTEQMGEVAGRMAEVFNARVKDILDELLETGLPIRASQVAVHPAIDLRFVL